MKLRDKAELQAALIVVGASVIFGFALFCFVQAFVL
jgi:hypothetical protein